MKQTPLSLLLKQLGEVERLYTVTPMPSVPLFSFFLSSSAIIAPLSIWTGIGMLSTYSLRMYSG